MPGARWFPGAAVNYAEHVFARSRPRRPVAIRHASELRGLGECTWGELRRRDGADPRRAGGARRRARRPRRRLPAEHPRDDRRRSSRRASLGAIWSSAAPEFGARSVIDRFAQIEPKVLLAVDGYRYGGERLRPPRQRRRDRRRDPRPRADGAARATSTGAAGRPASSAPRARRSSSPSCPSTTRSGSSTRRARPGCRSRSSTATAGSCSSTSRRCTCTSTRSRATGSSGSRRPAG